MIDEAKRCEKIIIDRFPEAKVIWDPAEIYSITQPCTITVKSAAHSPKQTTIKCLGGIGELPPEELGRTLAEWFEGVIHPIDITKSIEANTMNKDLTD